MEKTLKLKDMIQKPETAEEVIYNQLAKGEDRPTDEISMKALDELFSPKKLKMNSRLKMDQITSLTKMYAYSDTFGDPFTKKLADHILQLQISIHGLGRKETVQLVQQRNSMLELEEQRKPVKDVFR